MRALSTAACRSRRHPRSSRARRHTAGTTTLEIVVALPIIALLLSATTLLLFSALRGLGAQLDTITARLETRRSVSVLADALTPLRGRDVRIVEDTLIEIDAHTRAGVLCASVPSQILVAWTPGDDDLEAVRPGDAIELWASGAAPGDVPYPVVRSVRHHQDALSDPASVAACSRGTGRPLSWITVDSLVPNPLIGGPVLSLRRTRWVHYRNGTGWWIGRRRFDGITWDGTQPVAGPVDARQLGGMAITGWAQDGGTTSTIDSIQLLDVMVRRRAPAGRTAMAMVRMPLFHAVPLGHVGTPPPTVKMP